MMTYAPQREPKRATYVVTQSTKEDRSVLATLQGTEYAKDTFDETYTSLIDLLGHQMFTLSSLNLLTPPIK